MQLVPYGLGLGKGCEYGVEMYKAENYVPAMWGLILSLPKKGLYLSSESAEPGTEVDWPAPDTAPRPDSIAVRHLTCGGAEAYYCAPDGFDEWAICEYDFSTGKTRKIQGGFPKPAHELRTRIIMRPPHITWAAEGDHHAVRRIPNQAPRVHAC